MDIKLDFFAGTEISQAILESIGIARKLNKEVSFNFNGFTIFVTPDSNIDNLANEYFSRLNSYKIIRL